MIIIILLFKFSGFFYMWIYDDELFTSLLLVASACPALGPRVNVPWISCKALTI